MFTLSGQVVGVLSNVFKSGDREGQQYPVYQIMCGSDNYKQLLQVKDYNCLGHKVGDRVDLPVKIKTFVYRNGSPGMDISTIRLAEAPKIAKVM